MKRIPIISIIFLFWAMSAEAQSRIAAQSPITLLAQGQNQQALDALAINAQGYNPADQALLQAYAVLGLGDINSAKHFATRAKNSADKFLYFSLLARIASAEKAFNRSAWYYRRASDYAKTPMDQAAVSQQINIANARRRWEWSGSFNIQRSDNLNFATSAKTTKIGNLNFVLSEQSRAQKGWKTSADFTGNFRLTNATNRLTTLGFQLAASTDSVTKAKERAVGIQFGWKENVGKSQVSLSLNTRKYRDRTNTKTKNIGLSVSRPINQHLSAGVQFEKSITDYATYQLIKNSQSIFANFTITPHNSISAKLTKFDQPHNAANLDAYGTTLNVSYATDLKSVGLGISTFAEISRQNYRQETPFYGGLRKDETRKFGITIIPKNLNFAGFQPSLNWTKTNRISNKSINSATSQEVYFGLSSKF